MAQQFQTEAMKAVEERGLRQEHILRMTKRYAKIDNAQVRAEVDGLDVLFGFGSHPFVIETPSLPEASSVTQ